MTARRRLDKEIIEDELDGLDGTSDDLENDLSENVE